MKKPKKKRSADHPGDRLTDPAPVPADQPATRLALPGKLALAGSLLTGAFFGWLTPDIAEAQVPTDPESTRQTVRQFDIAPGTLRTVLEQFQAQTRIRTIPPAGISLDAPSSGLTGAFTPEAALRQILTGTYLTFRFEGPTLVRLVRAAPDADTPVRLAEVTVAAAPVPAPSSPKLNGPLRDTPQTITIVSSKLIEQQGAVTLRQVLRNVPGVTINAGEGGATPGDNFNVRGFSARGDMFVDGVRDLAGFSRESFNIEQVEVVKGPASTYSGRGSTGGSINTVSKTPKASTLRQIQAGIGSADYQRVTADLNQPLGNGAAVRVNALYHDADIPAVDVVTSRNWGIAPSVAIGLGSRTPVSVSYAHLDIKGIPGYGIQTFDSVPQQFDTHKFVGLLARDHEYVKTDQATARIEHHISPSLRVSNQLGYSKVSVDRVITFAGFNGARSSRSHVTSDEALANQTNLTAEFGTRQVGHRLSVGVDYTREEGTFTNWALSAPPAIADLANPNPNDPVTGTPTLNPARRTVGKTLAIYAFETLRLGDKIELSGGLRWDDFSPEFYPASNTTTIPDPPAQASVLNWRAGAVFKPRPNGSIYAAYSTSFNPSLQTIQYEGTSTLDPERNRSLEVGTKWDVADGRLALSAAIFRTDKTNARTSDPNDPALGTVLEGEQRVQGFELGATGYLTPAWSLFFGYSYMDSEILKSRNASQVGSGMPNVPKHSLSAWTSYAVDQRLDVALGARFVDDRLLSLGRTTMVPKYWAFDATGSYRILKELALKIEVHNLTDELYYDSGRFWTPAPGRSVRMSTLISF